MDSPFDILVFFEKIEYNNFSLHLTKAKMPRPIAPPPTEDLRIKKRGFKCDRVQRYRDKQTLQRGGKIQPPKGPDCPKEIKFNATDRRAFLATFDKSREKRKAKAVAQKKSALKRKNKTQRQDTRETARQQYNMSMHVPINPDFTMQLPGMSAQAMESTDGTLTTDAKMSTKVVYSNKAVVTSTPLDLPRNGPL